MQQKKRICFVSLFAYGIFNPEVGLKFGGSETQMYFLARKLAEKDDFSVSFIVLDVGQAAIEFREKVELIKAYARGGGLGAMFSGFFKLLAALKKANPEIIVCRAFGREVGVSALYAKIFRKKLVYCFANDEDAGGAFFGGLAGKIFKFGFLAANHYVAQSAKQAEKFKEMFPAKKEKIIIIKNSWPGSAPSSAEREFVLWVGSSSVLKKPEIFLDSAEARPEEKFVMVMARSKQGEKNWEELAARGRKLGNLRFLESVPFREIDDYFARAKVLVSTSSSEGFPNVFLQAALAKTPILSLAVDPDGFIEKHNGGIVCGNDFSKLNAGLKTLLADRESRDRKGENLYKYFQAEHDLDNNILKWEDFFRAL
jgi:glycosyltransferase involved in cell wall biosynthesis